MRAIDLDHTEFLELEPKAGLIRFAGARALLIDAVSTGLLRKYLRSEERRVGKECA